MQKIVQAIDDRHRAVGGELPHVGVGEGATKGQPRSEKGEGPTPAWKKKRKKEDSTQQQQQQPSQPQQQRAWREPCTAWVRASLKIDMRARERPLAILSKHLPLSRAFCAAEKRARGALRQGCRAGAGPGR